MTSKHHKHQFGSIWWHFGQYGRQDVHIHSCFDFDCDRVLVGEGRDCDGPGQPHHRETL
jgi:hypothetical protein